MPHSSAELSNYANLTNGLGTACVEAPYGLPNRREGALVVWVAGPQVAEHRCGGGVGFEGAKVAAVRHDVHGPSPEICVQRSPRRVWQDQCPRFLRERALEAKGPPRPVAGR